MQVSKMGSGGRFAQMIMLAVAGSVLLTACGSGASKEKASQVVARVNDHEVTESQLKQALRSLGAQATPEVARQALESVVNEELLVQEALVNKLDRDPQVLQQLERARRQVLTQAFLERKVYPKTNLSAAEVEAYYNANPILFSKHRVFQFAMFTVNQVDITAPINTALNSVSGADQVRALLEAHHVKYTADEATLPADSLPVSKLNVFANANPGDVMLMDQNGGRRLIMVVTNITESSISLEQAKSRIEEYLDNVRRKDAANSYLKVAKAAADISYSDKIPAASKAGATP